MNPYSTQAIDSCLAALLSRHCGDASRSPRASPERRPPYNSAHTRIPIQMYVRWRSVASASRQNKILVKKKSTEAFSSLIFFYLIVMKDRLTILPRKNKGDTRHSTQSTKPSVCTPETRTTPSVFPSVSGNLDSIQRHFTSLYANNNIQAHHYIWLYLQSSGYLPMHTVTYS